ncbi:ATP synthase subunit C lysine N-methyltransferase [Atheta coriaria]|uniref:ATP synthase subunit C lysine N-methyltransferase n=1 Tax=Dalotia coriaria TaxID=877792 RepID=UPI0031F40267
MATYFVETLNAKGEKSPENSGSTSLSTTGKILIGVTGGIALGLSVVCASFVSPAFRRVCLPYIPATEQQVLNVFNALKTKHRHGLLIDLGSGDGRIVFEAAKHNFQPHGVELNTWLVAYSKLSAFLNRAANPTVAFYQKDLWKFPLGAYDNVVIFGVEQMMHELEAKLHRECKPGCHIVACRFPLPGMKPEITVGSGVDTVWLYKIPNKIS